MTNLLCIDDMMRLNSKLQCTNCSRTYSYIDEVPYIGEIPNYPETLIELFSDSTRIQNGNYEQFDFRNILDSFDKFINGITEEEVLKKLEYSVKPNWWESRKQEHLEFQTLTSTINFDGLKILDVGAGYGSDSLRYFHLGAKVTCLEFSPAMFIIGSKLYPMFEWIGGSAGKLPFENESFDFIVAHHSLHHHQNIAQSIGEFDRVLKVGGRIITSGDPGIQGKLTETQHTSIFNNHEDVLKGVNEQVLFGDEIKDVFQNLYKNYRGYLLIKNNSTNVWKKSILKRKKSIFLKVIA